MRKWILILGFFSGTLPAQVSQFPVLHPLVGQRVLSGAPLAPFAYLPATTTNRKRAPSKSSASDSGASALAPLLSTMGMGGGDSSSPTSARRRERSRRVIESDSDDTNSTSKDQELKSDSKTNVITHMNTDTKANVKADVKADVRAETLADVKSELKTETAAKTTAEPSTISTAPVPSTLKAQTSAAPSEPAAPAKPAQEPVAPPGLETPTKSAASPISAAPPIAPPSPTTRAATPTVASPGVSPVAEDFSAYHCGGPKAGTANADEAERIIEHFTGIKDVYSKTMSQDKSQHRIFKVHPKISLIRAKKSLQLRMQIDLPIGKNIDLTSAAKLCIRGNELVFTVDNSHPVSGNRISQAGENLVYRITKVSSAKFHVTDFNSPSSQEHLDSDYSVVGK